MIQKLYLHYSSLKKLPNAFLCSLGKLINNHKEGKQRTWKKIKFSALHQSPHGQFWHRRERKHMDVPAWTGRKTGGHTGNLWYFVLPSISQKWGKNACRYTTADIAFFLRVKIKKRTQNNYVRSELLGQKSLAIPISVGFTLICTLTWKIL